MAVGLKICWQSTDANRDSTGFNHYLYFTDGGLSQCQESLLVFTGIPFALTGGVLFLWLRDIPLSMSAGIGFIALSVLQSSMDCNTFIKELRDKYPVHKAVWQGLFCGKTSVDDSLCGFTGFCTMAGNRNRAEVQPLATVVIGGIISSTLLTGAVTRALSLDK